MRKIKAFLHQRREPAAYVAAGILTTGVNYTVYSILTVLCGLGINLSNLIAWAAAVLVAFLTNKSFVFQKHDWSPGTVFREGLLFVGSRLLSGIVEIGFVPVLMALGVTQSVFGIPGFAAKLVAEAIAMILSYFLSKYAIFK
ncbi:MAG: GtrA family protein [Oscillibacter sp.]|nr:GtrA family protein [Oscillibacter sp.]